MNLSKAIKRNNDEHILRINIICADTKGLIEEIEKALIKAKIANSEAFRFLAAKKNETENICRRYSSHLEECTYDYINVDPEMVERVKIQTGEIKASIIKFTKTLPDFVRKNFPSYLLRETPLAAKRL